MSPLEDYELVEQAIEYLERHFREQPGLEEVARAVGLSEYHFQRLFKRWAGVSPKRFLQFLTLEYAKSLLAESRSLLDVTYEAGLSSPSRLHDLFVTMEAVTPGEYKNEGSGLEIAYGFHATPFGECLLAATSRGVCGLSFVQGGDREAALAELRQAWPGASLRYDEAATGELARRAFYPAESARDDKPLPLLVRGTNFQVKVWRALLEIPPGHALSYEDVAVKVGNRRASRAVGQAVGSNPISYLIPCHRVIRKAGDFGNYGGGKARKRAMLAWEAAQRWA